MFPIFFVLFFTFIVLMVIAVTANGSSKRSNTIHLNQSGVTDSLSDPMHSNPTHASVQTHASEAASHPTDTASAGHAGMDAVGGFSGSADFGSSFDAGGGFDGGGGGDAGGGGGGD